MAVKGLEETTSRLDQVKRFSGLVLVALLIAALVVGVLILSGLMGFVPTPRVPVFGIGLPSAVTAFIGAFTLALTIVLAYVYFAKLVKSSLGKALEFWYDLSPRIQAVVVGLEAGLVAGLAFYVTRRLGLWSFGLAVILGSVVVVGVVATLVTLRVQGPEWSVTGWARTLNLSALVAGLVAVLSGFTFAGVVPGYVLPPVFLAGWAGCVYLLFRRRQQIEDSVITRLLVRTRYAQMRRIDTISISIVTGLAVALVVAIIVGTAGTTPSGTLRRAGLSIALVWPVVTFATSFGWPDVERTDLVIDDISVRTATELRELTVRNLGNRPIDLRGAKVMDATNELYHIGITGTLSAGETVKFEIPEEFQLATHERYEVVGLPAGMVLMREAAEPEIVTRDGAAYVLRWIDQVRGGE